MVVTLYANTADERKLDKSGNLTVIANRDCIIKGAEMSITSPEIELATFTGFANVNYAYIPDLHRYYFIRSCDVATGGKIVYRCECDVLMSYAVQIKSIFADVIRSETAGANDIPDNKMPFSSDKNVRTILLPSDVFMLGRADNNSLTYILNISGGGASAS